MQCSLRLIGGAFMFAASLATAMPSPAHAGCDDEAEGDAEERRFRIEERDGERVYVLERAVKVCGKVPRPLVAYVAQARSIRYEWESLKQDFLPRILDSVKRPPF